LLQDIIIGMTMLPLDTRTPSTASQEEKQQR